MSNNEQRNLERQRLRAGRLLLKGYSQAEVARRVGVTRASVSGWNRRLGEGGLDALRSLGSRGRPASLDDDDRQRLKQLLLQGPMAHGFATDVWTVPRVRKLIIKEFEVKLSESQVWRVLKAMNFSPQRPVRQAHQQDEAAVRRWKRQVWPRLKKTPKNRAV